MSETKGCCDLSCWERRSQGDKLCTIGVIIAFVLLIAGLLIAVSLYESHRVSTCSKSECVQQASRTMAMMDRSMDPCEDFYQYACGAYVSDESTRDKSILIEQINKLNDLVKVILTENVKYGEPRFLSFPKMLYKSCMDQEKIIHDGIKPVKKYMKKFGGWPVAQSSWNESTFNWIALLKEFRESGLPFGYLLQVSYVQEEGVKLLIRGGTTYANLTNEEVKSSYLETLIQMAVRFGAERTVASEEMEAVVTFEIQLSKSAQGKQLVERVTIENLQKRYEFIDWLIFLRSSLGLNVPSHEIVLVVPSYLDTLNMLLETTPPRVIANYMMAKVHLFIVELLPKAVIKGGSHQPYEERQKLCVDFIRSNLWLATAALYQQKFFDESVSEGVNQILELLQAEFEKTIKRAKWMNAGSKQAALRKLKAMQVQIAFPKEIMDIRKLDNFHGDLGGQSALGTWRWIKDFVSGVIHSIKKTNHIVSDMTNREQKISFDRFIQEPKESIDKSANVMNKIAEKVEHRNAISKYNWWNMGDEAKWLGVSDQIQVRAKFEPQYNMLDIRAGILRGGFYHNKLPYYVNFGAIGAILAHELVHSIDSKGKLFDEFGKLRSAWRETSKKVYEKKFDCIIKQYNNYVEPLTGAKLNGTATLEENIADNLGLAIAYKAYVRWIRQNGHDLHLPGLNLTGRQLFWIANAQTQCANPSVGKIMKQISNSDTAPERFRVIGSVSNNKFFADDFKCPVGTPMNPKYKCQFW